MIETETDRALAGRARQLDALDKLAQKFGQSLGRAFSVNVGTGRQLDGALTSLGSRLAGLAGKAAAAPIRSGVASLVKSLINTGSGEDATAHGWRVDPATGSVGFGTAAAPGGPVPAAPVLIASASSATLLQLENYAAAGSPVVNITGRIGRGSAASPAPILAGDRFFAFFGRGFHAGGAFSGNVVTFNGSAEEDFTAAAQGTSVDFQTTDLGATARRTTVRFRANGALELVPRSSAPAAGRGAGQIVFDAGAAAFKGHDGTRWTRLTNPARFSATASADAAIAAGTWTKVPFDTADANVGGVFAAADRRFVAIESGTYAFGASLAFRKSGSAAPSALQVRLARNGTGLAKGRAGLANPVDGVSTVGLTAMLPLTAGDTVEVQALFTGGDGIVAVADSVFWGCGLA